MLWIVLSARVPAVSRRDFKAGFMGRGVVACVLARLARCLLWPCAGGALYRPSNGLGAAACPRRDGAVAVMGALLSMSLHDVMGALSIPVDMRAACPRVRCPSW